jgi:two-component system, OmpR family, sensor histidine kinase KdpD
LTVTTASSVRGRLKIYLGYAAGVGKTYQMLTEAQELARAGADVVIGYFEPHARADTIALTEGLETIPRRKIDYRGTTLYEMDTDAVLARHPAVAVVDEFPHTNAPGSPRAKRWEDVHALLDAGIDVLTTMNIQHIESLNDQIWQSTGVRVRETIPDWVVQQADEVVMVDLTPRALLNRLERGVVYPPERAQKALANFFKEPTLVALRELALRQTAQAIEKRAGADLAGGIARPGPSGEPGSTGRPVERVLLLIGPDPSNAALIRRGRRVADYLGAECLAAYVASSANLQELPADQRQQLERQLNFARGLQIETRLLVGSDVALTLVAFARLHGVTQIFVSRRTGRTWRSLLGRELVQRIVNAAPDMQVTIVADRTVRTSARERLQAEGSAAATNR